VKIQNKPKVIKSQEQTKVLQDVEKYYPGKELPTPTEEGININQKLSMLRQDLFNSMKLFNKLLLVKVLPENKSVKEKEHEQEVINNLVQNVTEIEKINQGEGVLALCVLSLRHTLSLRDAFNQQSYEINKIYDMINSSPKDKEEEAKNKVLELAKELGVKVSLGDK